MFWQPFKVMICRRCINYFDAFSRLFDFTIIICAFLVYELNRNAKHENGTAKFQEKTKIAIYTVHTLGTTRKMKRDIKFIRPALQFYYHPLPCRRKSGRLEVCFWSDFVISNSVRFGNYLFLTQLWAKCWKSFRGAALDLMR